jgi:cyclic pyranopterin phosphate synthase
MPGTCDGFQRGIDYLRVSVTDRCNLRCVYCMPPEGVPLLSHQDILSFEEIMLVVRAAVETGMDKIRITGGEPLVRAGIVELVRMIAAVEGIRDISMTTNGILINTPRSWQRPDCSVSISALTR